MIFEWLRLFSVMCSVGCAGFVVMVLLLTMAVWIFLLFNFIKFKIRNIIFAGIKCIYFLRFLVVSEIGLRIFGEYKVVCR